MKLLAIWLMTVPEAAAAPPPPPTFDAHDLEHIFVVEKTYNPENSMHYALRLDERCRFEPGSTVEPYWEMGDGTREGLIVSTFVDERTSYSVGNFRQTSSRTAEFSLAGVPSRTVEVSVQREGTSCRASLRVEVSGAPAALQRVRVVSSGPWGIWVQRMELYGLRDGQVQCEQFTMSRGEAHSAGPCPAN